MSHENPKRFFSPGKKLIAGVAALAITAGIAKGSESEPVRDQVPASLQAEPAPVILNAHAEYNGDTMDSIADRLSEQTNIDKAVISEHLQEVPGHNDGISTDPTDGVLTYNQEQGIGEPVRAVIPGDQALPPADQQPK